MSILVVLISTTFVLNLILSGLNLAAAGRSVRSQAIFETVLTERLSELSGVLEGAVNVLASREARQNLNKGGHVS